MKTALYHKGFTIVELLIVIVVIGILAAITITAYNGIQVRAENTKTSQAVAQYVKIVSMFVQENGSYPGPVAGIWACLPNTLSSCGSSDNNPSPSCFGLNNTPRNTTFDDQLKTIVTTLPYLSAKTPECSNGRTFLGGFIHVFNANKNADIYFPQIGDTSCPLVNGIQPSRAFEVNTTRCFMSLPTLQ